MAKVSIREYNYVIIGDRTVGFMLALCLLDNSAIYIAVLKVRGST